MKAGREDRSVGPPGSKTLPGLTSFALRKILAGSLVLFATLTGVTGCGENEQNEPASLPTRGVLVIGIDESLKPFARAEIAMFTTYYPDAEVTPLYLPEKRVIEMLLANEIQTAVVCRDLYPDETDYIAGTYGHSARTFKLADDAIVAVVNSANPVSTLSLDDMRRILSGTISDWGQLSASIETESPMRVILTRESSIDRYFFSSAPLSPASTYALETTTEVVDYVKKSVLAIGIVGGSWFYEKGKNNKDVKILTYSTGTAGIGDEEKIPSREVYAVTHEPNTGLGSGFISFMAGQKGQLILEKAGMTPYRPIEREIKLSGTFPD